MRIKSEELEGLDFSTLNGERIKRLSAWEDGHPQTYQLSDHLGSGCYGDPPGYPTYFLRHVYTQYGNSPGQGAQEVIYFEGKNYIVRTRKRGVYLEWKVEQSAFEKFMRSLWLKLPIDHPRTRGWIKDKYRHHRHCYTLPEGVVLPTIRTYGRSWDNKMLIYPVPYYELESFHDDERFSEAWRERERARVESNNAEIEAAYASVAVPENHQAVTIIRRFYPDYAPELNLIESPPEQWSAWWERRAEPQSVPLEAL